MQSFYHKWNVTLIAIHEFVTLSYTFYFVRFHSELLVDVIEFIYKYSRVSKIVKMNKWKMIGSEGYIAWIKYFNEIDVFVHHSKRLNRMLERINFSPLIYGTVQINANRFYDIGFYSIIKHILEKSAMFLHSMCIIWKLQLKTLWKLYYPSL